MTMSRASHRRQPQPPRYQVPYRAPVQARDIRQRDDRAGGYADRPRRADPDGADLLAADAAVANNRLGARRHLFDDAVRATVGRGQLKHLARRHPLVQRDELDKRPAEVNPDTPLSFRVSHIRHRQPSPCRPPGAHRRDGPALSAQRERKSKPIAGDPDV